jgi:uncharacterized protein YwqG
MIKEDFIAKLKTNKLDHHLNKFESIWKSCIRLYLTPTKESDIKLGQSKMGGRPHLPAGIDWLTEAEDIATGEKRSLSFIAQINLSDISKFDSQNLLPTNGILYFFYCADQDAWGFDIKHRSKFKVLYFDGEDHLHRTDFPDDLGEDARFGTCLLTPKQEVSLPTYFSEEYDFMTGEDSENYYENVLEGNSKNKMLGYSDNIQDEMELQCELVTNGLDCGDSSGYSDPRRKELEPNAKDWLLLLQVDSNEKECGMMWGDLGRLYFWIKKQDLQHKQFDKSWLILQCS